MVKFEPANAPLMGALKLIYADGDISVVLITDLVLRWAEAPLVTNKIAIMKKIAFFILFSFFVF
jgi:hypothetical protein